MATRATAPVRYSFGNSEGALELPDLIASRPNLPVVPRRGLAQTFRDISPIKDFSENLQLELEFDPLRRPAPATEVHGGGVQRKGHDLLARRSSCGRVHERNTGEIKEQTVFMGDFPMHDREGHVHRQRHRACRCSPARPQPRRDLRAW